jgi:hypothetical protein
VIRLIAAASLAASLAGPALATEWVNCADPTGAASFDFLVGTLDVINISGLTITVGEQVWASDASYGPGDPVSVGQAFETPEMLLVDAMDENMASKIAELRLFKASEGTSELVYAGTLRIPGYGAWAVSCSGG